MAVHKDEDGIAMTSCSHCGSEAWRTETGEWVCSSCDLYVQYCACKNLVERTEEVKRRAGQSDTIKFNIINLMKSDERCRNDDKWLLYRYGKDVMKMDWDDFEQWSRMPSIESVRRIRQMIQNTAGLFLPTNEETRESRGIQEQAWRRWVLEEKLIYGYNSSQIKEVLEERLINMEGVGA